MGHVHVLELAPGSPRTHMGMTVFPLVSLSAVELPYLLLEDALGDGVATIRELGEGARVGSLSAVNRAETEVLILDGEQLIGAKQDRMANRSLLLPPESETEIPVSCIEQGRWRHESSSFRPSRQHSPTATRKSVRDLEAQLASGGVAAPPSELQAAQASVWSGVADYSAAFGIAPATGALDEVSEGVWDRLRDWIPRFTVSGSQVGLLVFMEEKPLGLDVVGGRTLYARLHERLLRGYALEALRMHVRAEQAEGERTEARRPIDESAALRFLASVDRAGRTGAPTVGVGDYQILSGPVVGAELFDDERLVHRSAFVSAAGAAQ